MSDRLVGKLSDLTPAVVDRLYGIDTAMPQAAPTFVFLVGAPGVGKSSGHAEAIKEGYLPACSAGGYATINLDTLLESLVPFRAGSALAYVLKKKYKPEDKAIPAPVSFSSIHMYGSKKENVGSFGWYDDTTETKGRGAAKVTSIIKKARSKIRNIGDNTTNANIIRNKFLDLKDKEVVDGKSIIDINKDAIQRAILKSIPIIYETTMSVSIKLEKDTRKVIYECVKKFDELVRLLYGAGSLTCKMPDAKPMKVSAAVGGAGTGGADENVTNVEEPSAIGPQYNLIVLHLTPEKVENVAIRIKSRQESGMPYEKYPYYRYVPSSLEDDPVKANRLAVETITTQYAGLIADGKLTVKTIVINLKPELLPKEKNFNAGKLTEHIIEAYGLAPDAVDGLSHTLSGVHLSNPTAPSAAMGGAGGPTVGGARRSRRRRHHRRRSTNKKR